MNFCAEYLYGIVVWNIYKFKFKKNLNLIIHFIYSLWKFIWNIPCDTLVRWNIWMELKGSFVGVFYSD